MSPGSFGPGNGPIHISQSEIPDAKDDKDPWQYLTSISNNKSRLNA